MKQEQAKKKVLVIDYYRRSDPKTPAPGATEIKDAIEKAGGQAKIMHHSEADEIISKDLLSKYDSGHASGSDISWTKKQDKTHGEYMDPGSNKLAEYLINHKKPVQFECGSGHAAYHALGLKVRHTGKINRGKGKDGHVYHHTYGMDVNDVKGSGLEKKLNNVQTFKHNKKDYVASFDYGNNKIVQYHPARTDQGKKEIKQYHGLT